MDNSKRWIHRRLFTAAVTLAFAALVLAGCGGVTPTSLDEPPGKASAPPDRHIALAGQSNFRDLGGYRTTDGRTVKWGQVYRSGELGQCTGEDVATMETLGLRTVVSFLLPEEIEKHGPDRLPEGTRNSSVSAGRSPTIEVSRRRRST